MPTATTNRPAAPSPSGRNGGSPLQTRRGSVVAAVVTALIAGTLLIVYLHNYRRSTNDSKTETVISARSLLPRGSSGSTIASRGLFQAVNVKHSDVKPGAITDPSVLRGQVTTTSIFPGEQITTADLRPSAASGIVDEISGHQRAVALTIDQTRGLSGALEAGDHVDVYGNFGNLTRELAQDIVVLRPPTAASGGTGGNSGGSNVVLKVPERLAGKLIYASSNNNLWLTLRPPVGAAQNGRSTDTLTTVLK